MEFVIPMAGKNMKPFCLWAGVTFLVNLSVPVSAAADPLSSELMEPIPADASEIIVQIGGRYCEYHRDDVERALRRYEAVRRVDFLNNHGTVLVRYQPEGVRPVQLAESVERALSMGIGCKAWVDRGVTSRPVHEHGD